MASGGIGYFCSGTDQKLKLLTLVCESITVNEKKYTPDQYDLLLKEHYFEHLDTKSFAVYDDISFGGSGLPTTNDLLYGSFNVGGFGVSVYDDLMGIHVDPLWVDTGASEIGPVLDFAKIAELSDKIAKLKNEGRISDEWVGPCVGLAGHC